MQRIRNKSPVVKFNYQSAPSSNQIINRDTVFTFGRQSKQ